ncbi:ralBP1-associated Eps domain-containing protein 2 isoform X1 [Hippocampus zosterae]|uniref:ralBP1-associated Eps domain-containing protein 2 isoform X1 n=1 Tax=Hippocampus zosterae TaxID=109293 RepID=UPI00223E615A|nr:ralBP1-associated Eps domain-containing protein 2 isoform X1 [Hippocampus zosterae]
MEQEGGGGGAVAAAVCAGGLIPVHEHEQRYYSALHGLCQADPSGKQLSSSKVAELFKASQLPADVLHKVTEMCGAKSLGYFGTAEFYVALKLLAAAQAGLPVRLQSTSANLPLPRFAGITTEPEMRYVANTPGGIEARCDRSRCLEQKEPPPALPGSSPPCSPLAYHAHQYTTPKERQTAESHMEKGECDDDDPWRITEEQREYYTNQFKSLQPDLGALILGAVAKNFFTKSKLPIPELSHIWELSDVDRDGALTFPEFCAAFHLIVARKNGYPLPESLPVGLHPKFGPPDEDGPPQRAELLIVFDDGATGVRKKDQSTKLPTSVAGTKQDCKEEAFKKQECNFRGVETLKEGATLQLATFSHRPANVLLPTAPSSQDLDPQSNAKTRPRSYSSTFIDTATRKAEEPPAPPPRPQKKSHSRASSLDLNKLFQQGAPGAKSGWLLPPPALPPRPSASQVPPTQVQQPNFADFSRFRKEEQSSVKPEERCLYFRYNQSIEDLSNASQQELNRNQAPQKPARRKFRPDSQNAECSAPPTGSFLKSAQKTPSRQKKEIHMAIRKNKETNAVLTRLNSELQQQLKVVRHQRVTLETQLDQLRPVASTSAGS